MLSINPMIESWDISTDLTSFTDGYDSQTLALLVKRVLQFRSVQLGYFRTKVYARDILELLNPLITLVKDQSTSPTAHLRLNSDVYDVEFSQLEPPIRRISVFGAHWSLPHRQTSRIFEYWHRAFAVRLELVKSCNVQVCRSQSLYHMDSQHISFHNIT